MGINWQREVAFLNRWFFDLPADVATALATLAGFVLNGRLTVAQQNSLGNLLELTGQLLLANAAQQQLLDQNGQSDRTRDLEQQVEQLRRRLDRMEARGNDR